MQSRVLIREIYEECEVLLYITFFRFAKIKITLSFNFFLMEISPSVHTVFRKRRQTRRVQV